MNNMFSGESPAVTEVGADVGGSGPIDHVSFSQIDMGMRCLRQWYYSYRLGIKQPPSGAMAFGSGIGKGLEMGYRDVIAGKGLPPKSFIVDVFADTFKAKARDVDWQREEKETPNHMLLIGRSLLEKFRDERMPTHDPVATEDKVEIKLPSIPVKIVGALDLLERSRKIIDFKTSSKAYSEGEAAGSLQLRLYSVFKELQTGLPHPDVAFEVMIKHADPAKVRLQYEGQVATITDSQRRQAIGMVSSIVTAILRLWDCPEYAWPVCNPKGNYLCSERWCGYWAMCRNNLERYGEYKGV